MSDTPMTEEEYLIARGWALREDKGWWRHPRHCKPERSMRLAEAVETQLREDRSAISFVLARSPGLFPSDDIFGSTAFAQTVSDALDPE